MSFFGKTSNKNKQQKHYIFIVNPYYTYLSRLFGDYMTNVTLSIPDQYYSLMKKHSEIKWTEVMRNAAIIKLRELEDNKIKTEAINYAGENWDDAKELFNF